VIRNSGVLAYGLATEVSNLLRIVVQGKPVARRGRKARDLRRKTARLPTLRGSHPIEDMAVKTNLARFTWALMLLASLALAAGAGIRWG